MLLVVLLLVAAVDVVAVVVAVAGQLSINSPAPRAWSGQWLDPWLLLTA